jgi:acyl carrier protein
VTVTTRSEIHAAIADFIREVGQVEPDDPGFTDDADLFDAGYLDSLGIVSLTAFIEQRFRVVLTEQDLFNPRIATVTGMVEIIAARSVQQAA